MRADGRRVKDMNSMYHLIPQFLTRRWDSMNMITVDIPLDPIKEYKNLARYILIIQIPSLMCRIR